VKMSFSQHVLLTGVLSWGVGMFLYSVTNTYMEWRLFHRPWQQPTVYGILHDLCIWLVAGVVFGFFIAFINQRKSTI
jgi:hypothetical protein